MTRAADGVRIRRFRSLLTRLFAVLLAFVAPDAAAQALVILSDDSAGYREVADALRTGLRQVRDGGVRVDVLTVDRLGDLDDAAFNAYELVLTVGLAAAQPTIAREHGLAKPPPTLCVMIPRQSFERLAPPDAGARDRRLSALFIDQPLSRQLDLVRLALPGKRRVGAILGPSSATQRGELQHRADERGLTLNLAEVAESSGVYGALQTVVRKSELLLVVPDPVATNPDTIYGLLLTSYRAQLPVVGFSEGLAKAGALVSLFSTARQQGSEAAEIAAKALGVGGTLPPPQYPKQFTVRVNLSVARSLGLLVADEADLAKTLAASPSTPEEHPRTHPTPGTPEPGGSP